MGPRRDCIDAILKNDTYPLIFLLGAAIWGYKRIGQMTLLVLPGSFRKDGERKEQRSVRELWLESVAVSDTCIGRDKMLRFVQYFCRMTVGLLMGGEINRPCESSAESIPSPVFGGS